MQLAVCLTDDDYEAWRAVRLAVEADSRTLNVEELREQDSADRLLLLAVEGGDVVGSGIADRAETAGAGFVGPRVLSGHRRLGVGSALLRVLAEHCSGLGLSTVRTNVDDQGSLAFAERHGFVEVDCQVEQVRAVGDEPAPTALLAGVEVIEARANAPTSGPHASRRSERRCSPTSPCTRRCRSASSSGTRRGSATRCSWPCTTTR